MIPVKKMVRDEIIEDSLEEDYSDDLSCLSQELRDKDEVNIGYTRFHWVVMEEFNITLPEAMLMTLIYNLSRKTGWCHASKEYFAKALGVTRQTIHSYILKLRYTHDFIRIGPIDRSVRLIKPSHKWHQLMECVTETHKRREIENRTFRRR